MRIITSKLMILALASCAAGSPKAQETLPVRNCTWCHGASGQGYTTAPRLAGQKPQYIESQLRSFKDHSRDNPYSKEYMWGATARLSPQAARDFAHYFAALTAEPANDGDGALAAEGRDIYQHGVAEANIAACLVCHGPNGEGFEGIPRLGGLSRSYLKARLEQWSEGFHASAAPMPQVAKTLFPSQVEAIASYLSFVK